MLCRSQSTRKSSTFVRYLSQSSPAFDTTSWSSVFIIDKPFLRVGRGVSAQLSLREPSGGRGKGVQ